MKVPTDKQFEVRVLALRAQVDKLVVRVGNLKCYGPSVIGRSKYHLLQTTLDALQIAELQLIEFLLMK